MEELDSSIKINDFQKLALSEYNLSEKLTNNVVE